MKLKPYPEYKPSINKWVGKLPSYWEEGKLKEIAKVSPSNVDKDSIDGEQPVRLCNYTDVYKNEYIIPAMELMQATASTAEIAKFRVKKGDVLVTKDSEEWSDIAVSAYVMSDMGNTLCGYHLAQVTPNRTLTDGEYLFRSFTTQGINDQFKVAATGITRYGIDKYSLDNSLFPVPSLNEQQTIAGFLRAKTRSIDNLILNKKHQIELLQEKYSALISHVVMKGLNPNVKMKDSGVEWLGKVPEHWEVQRLKYNSYIKGRIGWQNLRSEEFTDSGPFLVTGMHFKDGYVDWSACFHITEDRYVMAPEIYVKVGDILITKDGSIGKLAFISTIPGKASLNSHLLIIRPNKETYYPRFMYHLLSSNVFQHFILREQSGTTFYGISQESIENFPALFPPVDEQKLITSFLDEQTNIIDKTAQKINESIVTLREYRTALISAAVTGKIDVRQEA